MKKNNHMNTNQNKSSSSSVCNTTSTVHKFDETIQSMDLNAYCQFPKTKKDYMLRDKFNLKDQGMDSIVDFLLQDDNFELVITLFFKIDENYYEFKKQFERIYEQFSQLKNSIDFAVQLVEESGGAFEKSVLDYQDFETTRKKIKDRRSKFTAAFTEEFIDSFFSGSDSTIFDFSNFQGFQNSSVTIYKNSRSKNSWITSVGEVHFLDDFFYSMFFSADPIPDFPFKVSPDEFKKMLNFQLNN